MFASTSEVTDALLQAGSAVAARDEHGRTALIYAATHGVTESLIKAGADVNEADNDGNTPLMCAAENGDMESMQSLLAADADITARTKEDRTVLMFSATADVARAAIDAGADLHATDAGDNTALHSVVEGGDIQLVHALVTSGIDAASRNKDKETALSLAKAAGYDEIVKLLEP